MHQHDQNLTYIDINNVYKQLCNNVVTVCLHHKCKHYPFFENVLVTLSAAAGQVGVQVLKYYSDVDLLCL